MKQGPIVTQLAKKLPAFLCNPRLCQMNPIYICTSTHYIHMANFNHRTVFCLFADTSCELRNRSGSLPTDLLPGP